MAILGLTHNDKGAALQELPVTVKVAIGEGPNPDDETGHPRPLFHFVFKRKVLRSGKVPWVPAPDIAEAYGEEPKEIRIILLHDHPDAIFPSKNAWWTQEELRCWGELVQISNGHDVKYEMQATRRTAAHPEGEVWPAGRRYNDGAGHLVEGCGKTCPEKVEGKCRPSGDLYFILERFPHLGAVCRLHTSSPKSIQNLSSALEQYRAIYGGLKWTRARLRVTPERGRYPNRETGEWQWGIYPILSIEIGAENLERLIANRNQDTRADTSEQALIAGAPGFVVREDDTERAFEISSEFCPQNDAKEHEQAPQEPDENAEKHAALCELARRLGYNEGRWQMLWGQCRGKLGEIERKLKIEVSQGEAVHGVDEGASDACAHPVARTPSAGIPIDSQPKTVLQKPKPLPTNGLLF